MACDIVSVTYVSGGNGWGKQKNLNFSNRSGMLRILHLVWKAAGIEMKTGFHWMHSYNLKNTVRK
jgi:hypothetical protein